jgi:hypothetical protein
MKTRILLVLFVALWGYDAVCQNIYPGVDALRDIKEGYLVVRLPGFEKKLLAIDSVQQNGTLSERAVRNLEMERERTLYNKALIHKWYPLAFDSIYQFSKVVFIYTQETHEFQSGSVFARSCSGVPVSDVLQYPYVFATLNGVHGDPFEFTTPDHRTVSYPLPDRIAMPGILALSAAFTELPVWLDAEEHTVDIYGIYLHVTRLNRKINKIFSKWVVGTELPASEVND